MPADPQKRLRRSLRLPGYDYSQAGAYFVTICTQHMVLLCDPPPVREMIQRWWNKLPEKYPTVGIDAFVIMPNHIHGIVLLTDPPVGVDPCVDPVPPTSVGADLRVDPVPSAPVGIDLRVDPIPSIPVGVDPCVDPIPSARTGVDPVSRADPGQTRGSAPTVSLARVVQWFKTMTTNEYIRGVKELGWQPFPGKFWQRNYYEHIIRDEADYQRIYEYIRYNPDRWLEDELHPTNLDIF